MTTFISRWKYRLKEKRTNKACLAGNHGDNIGHYWEPAVGGREVKKCWNCAAVVEERGVSLAEAKKHKQMWGRGTRTK